MMGKKCPRLFAINSMFLRHAYSPTSQFTRLNEVLFFAALRPLPILNQSQCSPPFITLSNTAVAGKSHSFDQGLEANYSMQRRKGREGFSPADKLALLAQMGLVIICCHSSITCIRLKSGIASWILSPFDYSSKIP